MNPFRRKTETPEPESVEPAEPPVPETPVSVAETDEKDPFQEYEEILKKQDENARIWREMTLMDLKPQVFAECFRKLSPSEYPAELPVLMQIAASLHDIADILRSLQPQESWNDHETGGAP